MDAVYEHCMPCDLKEQENQKKAGNMKVMIFVFAVAFVLVLLCFVGFKCIPSCRRFHRKFHAWRNRRKEALSLLSAQLSLAVITIQTVYIVGLNHERAGGEALPRVFTNWIDLFKVFINFNPFSFMPGLPCLSMFKGYFNNVLAQTAGYAVFGIGCLACWWSRKKKGHRRIHAPLTWFVLATKFSLAALSRTICSGFRCEIFDAGQEGVETFLLADLAIDCTSNAYKTIVIYNTFMMLIFPIGMPLFAVVQMYRLKPHLDRMGEAEKDVLHDVNLVKREEKKLKRSSTSTSIKAGPSMMRPASAKMGQSRLFMTERVSSGSRLSARPKMDVSGTDAEMDSDSGSGSSSDSDADPDDAGRPQRHLHKTKHLTADDIVMMARKTMADCDQMTASLMILETSPFMPLFDNYRKGFSWWFDSYDMFIRLSLTCGTLIFGEVNDFLLFSIAVTCFAKGIHTEMMPYKWPELNVLGKVQHWQNLFLLLIMLMRDGQMYQGTPYELIGSVLLLINLLLVTLIGRAAFPVLFRNLFEIGKSIRRGSITNARVVTKRLSMSNMVWAHEENDDKRIGGAGGLSVRRDSVQLSENINPMLEMRAMERKDSVLDALDQNEVPGVHEFDVSLDLDLEGGLGGDHNNDIGSFNNPLHAKARAVAEEGDGIVEAFEASSNGAAPSVQIVSNANPMHAELRTRVDDGVGLVEAFVQVGKETTPSVYANPMHMPAEVIPLGDNANTKATMATTLTKTTTKKTKMKLKNAMPTFSGLKGWELGAEQLELIDDVHDGTQMSPLHGTGRKRPGTTNLAESTDSTAPTGRAEPTDTEVGQVAEATVVANSCSNSVKEDHDDRTRRNSARFERSVAERWVKGLELRVRIKVELGLELEFEFELELELGVGVGVGVHLSNHSTPRYTTFYIPLVPSFHPPFAGSVGTPPGLTCKQRSYGQN